MRTQIQKFAILQFPMCEQVTEYMQSLNSEFQYAGIICRMELARIQEFFIGKKTADYQNKEETTGNQNKEETTDYQNKEETTGNQNKEETTGYQNKEETVGSKKRGNNGLLEQR
jgi:hypothetical protein